MTYLSKSNNSFKSRLRIFLFDKIINGQAVDSFLLEEFLQYDLSGKQSLINKFTAEFYHTKRKQNLSGTDMQIDDIYLSMKEAERDLKQMLPNWRKEYFHKVFRNQLQPDKFKELQEADTCYYCEITLNEILELVHNKKIYKKNERGWRMEIDRKEPNQEYSNENCVPACYWCNNAKTDEFDAEEFKPIGKAIGELLRERLKKLP
ncbi:hypothetical protein JKA74_19880 [Marivirga sp. S37H4]|uniref:HNH domain-containing protein n=1 Tax=Marivirga aurantiaca TaxID=2802615 RepID=A0A935CC84_9BACT|nr:hypothetical protein [Marivirga aurantiaca]MBK6267312.1 hypothetical protein [Marivirga aurantiaca]